MLTGCLTTSLENTIPDEVQERFDRVSEASVAVRVATSPEGEQVKISTGATELTLNRLFSYMVAELAQTKFGEIDEASENALDAAITYLNVEERTYHGTPYLHRIDMSVRAEVRNGEGRIAREFTYSAIADVQGYALRTNQIYDLLLRSIVAIDGLIDAQFAAK